MLAKLQCHLHPLLSFHTLLFIVLSLHFLPTMQVAFNYNNFSESSVTFASTLAECPEQLEKICLHGDAFVGENGEIYLERNMTDMMPGGTDYVETDYYEMMFNQTDYYETDYDEMTSSSNYAFHSERIQMWNKQTNRTADFTTEFTFSFNSYFQQNNMGFFILSDPKDGWWMNGEVLISILTGEYQNAVQIYARSESSSITYDPSAVIAGVVKANSSHRVEVHYNDVNSNLTVLFDSEDLSNTTILSLSINLQTLLPENVSVGFFVEEGILKITSWSFASDIIAVEEWQRKSPSMELVVSVVVGFILLILFYGLTMFFWKRKMKEKTGEDNTDIEEDWILDAEFEDEQHGPKKLSYRELEKATDNFNPKRKLGEGGFGPVYRGFLKYHDVNVAIKRISGHSKQGKKEYIAEVKIISQMRHKNMVQLIGWCHEKGEFLLVYELMENGSLDSYLFDHEKSLSWPLRYTISKGLASALIYLHQEWKQCVVHRDVKAGNVMLDKSFNAKLGDFGLARLSDHGSRAKTTFIGGTIGYMAPEYFMTGKGSKESDVYAFGIVALEIVCGRKCIELNTDTSEEKLDEWVWKMYGCGRLLDVVDERILNGDEYIELQVKQLLMVGLCCAHPDLKQRPSMSHALGILNFESPLPTLPMKKPEIGITTTLQQSNISCTTDTTST